MRYKNKWPILILMLLAGMTASAQTASAQTADDLLQRGRDAFMDYRFQDATKLYSQAKARSKHSDEFFNDKYSTYLSQLNRAKSFLERVEQIEIIDSITVNRNDFFKAYRLPSSAGQLGGHNTLPRSFRDEISTDFVFTNEEGTYKMWCQETDSTENKVIFESSMLTDGTWSEPSGLPEELGEGGDCAYPFMMADGVTLYYASNGDNSIGGYDIMVATRDAADGTFLQPSNLGFPYNSPYDDYLLAIDELNGVGWWATDRNNLDDEITIYVFIPNELRNNYPPDTPGLTGFARIKDINATLKEGSDFSALLDEIDSINPGQSDKEPDFFLPASKGRIFKYFEELPDNTSRTVMKQYLSGLKELQNEERNLKDLRKDYFKTHSEGLGRQIESLEKQISTKRSSIKKLRSDLYKSIGQ